MFAQQCCQSPTLRVARSKRTLATLQLKIIFSMSFEIICIMNSEHSIWFRILFNLLQCVNIFNKLDQLLIEESCPW